MADGDDQVDVEEKEIPSLREKKISYPLNVLYCGVCTMPIEYCEFSPVQEKCLEWLKSNHPDAHETLLNATTDQIASLDVAEGKKSQKRGGKGMMRLPKQKQMSGPKKVTISKEQRSKKKCVTIIKGLDTFGIDLKKASKAFSQKFSCGSSISGDEIVIQGDIADDLIDFIQDKWPEIDDDSIEDKS